MQELKDRATLLWTQLLEALRQDGLIATCVTQSGPATTAIIVKLVSNPVFCNKGPWLPMTMKPQPGKQVMGQDANGQLLAPVEYSEEYGWSHTNLVKWAFVELPESE